MTQDVEAFRPVGETIQRKAFLRRLSQSTAPWRRRPLGFVGAIIFFLLLVLAFTAPLVAPYGPIKFEGKPLESPSSKFLLGTNSLGQDAFSRAIYGAQISMAVGVVATMIGVGGGTILGIVSGYMGGWVDIVIQRLLEVLASIPGLVLTLIMIAALGRTTETGTNVVSIAWDMRSLELAIALSFLFGATRIIRSAVLAERNTAYIAAADAIGVPSFRILWRHILPNTMPYIIVAFTTVVGIAILLEAAISFLGYGAPLGVPSWGVDLSGVNRQYFLAHPNLLIGPGMAISLTVLGLNFFGDALRDILDPRLRGSR